MEFGETVGRDCRSYGLALFPTTHGRLFSTSWNDLLTQLIGIAQSLLQVVKLIQNGTSPGDQAQLEPLNGV